MHPNALKVLDKAIEAGGENLTAKTIAGTSQAALTILAEFVTSAVLNKTEGRSPKYSVTQLGRDLWEEESLPERIKELKELESKKKHEILVEFINLIEKKKGAALTRPEQTKFNNSIREFALARKYISQGDRPNSYVLLSDGEVFRLGQQPLEEQLDGLMSLHKQAVNRWYAAQQHLRGTLKELGEVGTKSLKSEYENLSRQLETARELFDRSLPELKAFSGFLLAAEEFKKSVEASGEELRKRCETDMARVDQHRTEIHQTLKEAGEILETKNQKITEQIHLLAKQLTQTASDSCLPTASSKPQSDELLVWEVTRRSCEKIHRETIRAGGIVKIPELTDVVCKEVHGLEVKAFHQLLIQWQQAERLKLQLCNNPQDEERASEGIKVDRGLLFYVKLREGN